MFLKLELVIIEYSVFQKNMTDFTIESSLVCTLTKDKHILTEPRRLPCKRIACLSCIKKQKKKFICKFCRNEHDNSDFLRDLLCEESLESNLDKLSSHELRRLKAVSLVTKNLFSNSNNAIDGLFDFYKYDIELRFESLRSSVDIKAKESLNNIRKKLDRDFDDLKMEFNQIDVQANKSLIELENNHQKVSNIGKNSFKVFKKILIMNISILFIRYGCKWND